MNRLAPLLVLVAAIIVFILSETITVTPSPPQERKGETVVSFWAWSTPAQTVLQLKDEFEASHPGIRVEVQTVPWQSLQQKALWAIAAESNVPDVIVASSEWMGGLANSGALEPLDDHLPPNFFERYFQQTLGIYQFPEVRRDVPGWRGGMKQYGIPLDLDMALMYYRADILGPIMEKAGLQQFPTTWKTFDQLVNAVRSMPAEGAPKPYLMFLDPQDLVPISMAFLPSSGASIMDRTLSRVIFDSAEGVAGFTFFQHLLKSGVAIQWEQDTMGDPMVLFKTGKALASISGPFYAKYLQNRAPELAGKWRIALFPRRAPELPASGLGGACLAMSYNARHKQQALELIKFMATDRFALAYFDRVGSPPPQVTAWSDPEFDSPVPYFQGQKIYQTIRQGIENAKPLQLLPTSEIATGPMKWALKTIAEGEPDTTQVLHKAAEEANRILLNR